MSGEPDGKRRTPKWLIWALAIPVAGLAFAISPLGDRTSRLMQERAAVVVQADFAQPIEGWFGPRDWSREWTRAGRAVRVGQLAIYRPSVDLTDYVFEFEGQLDRTLGWVFRASDLNNYYMARLVPGGEASQLMLERSVIVAGEQSHRVQVPVRDRFDLSRPVRITLEASGSDFKTSINGRVVDFFHDELLPSGGVGLTGQPDDRPRIQWMAVRHHDDLLGKVCGWLAPNRVSDDSST